MHISLFGYGFFPRGSDMNEDFEDKQLGQGLCSTPNLVRCEQTSGEYASVNREGKELQNTHCLVCFNQITTHVL
jgi:hypothetical protein